MHKRNVHSAGFTIVELLIVIVVIAILAAISIVAFTGIQDRAAASKAQSDLKNIHQKLALYHAEHERYPETAQQVRNSGIAEVVQRSENNYAIYCGSASGYEVVARTVRQNFRIGSELALTEDTERLSGATAICAATSFPTPPNYGMWNHFW